MTEETIDTYARESHARLTRAEQTGLRLALVCRSAVTGAAFAWYVLAFFIFPDVSPRFATIIVLLGFTALGVAHLVVIGTAYDRPWIKYVIYALDALAICAAFALVPISRADDVPQIIAFRAYGIYFLFPLLAMSCLSLSWRLVLWTGGMIVVGWWAAFAWIVTGMQRFLSWSDMPSIASRADYEEIFLSIDFIGRGNRIEETAMVFFATIALAVGVYRAREVFFAQVAADVEREREKSLRERVSDLLGKHVPETIAEQLIAEDAPMKPQRSRGTALVMDIAGFTAFSARHDPETVIESLDNFLADTSQVVAENGGVVLSYLGDGFLATFNAPVSNDRPEHSAIDASKALLAIAEQHRFDIRIGVATGDLVTGIVGSDSRQAFTVYGDTVNLASRLEASCKKLQTPIALDSATAEAVKTLEVTNSLGKTIIRGISEPVDLYALKLSKLA
ncbi:MAG: adenylate/guanylate cyclase domain-containing protein [Pseudomonadota bacterium]